MRNAIGAGFGSSLSVVGTTTLMGAATLESTLTVTGNTLVPALKLTKASSTPSATSAGQGWLYTKSNGNLYWRSSNSEIDISTATEGSFSSLSVTGDITMSAGNLDVAVGKIGVGTSDPNAFIEIKAAGYLGGPG